MSASVANHSFTSFIIMSNRSFPVTSRTGKEEGKIYIHLYLFIPGIIVCLGYFRRKMRSNNRWPTILINIRFLCFATITTTYELRSFCFYCYKHTQPQTQNNQNTKIFFTARRITANKHSKEMRRLCRQQQSYHSPVHLSRFLLPVFCYFTKQKRKLSVYVLFTKVLVFLLMKMTSLAETV